ncbi:hypothetical protein M378DRAFT_460330 [Amanita muscaria Koide BX008]|uniref:Uncharacterized protein n=1 Tax=Amanita muscaria (strain Koide BX008) TaxID=946122 RepID=A0A0C2SR43_AMAMK|nr:hypothetical protein M378DRAFT_460330 [Amanita muscaria Koide BX008]
MSRYHRQYAFSTSRQLKILTLSKKGAVAFKIWPGGKVGFHNGFTNGSAIRNVE